MQTQNLIPNYGWVPFPHFQHILIIVLLVSYSFYKPINKTMNKHVYDKIKNKTASYYLKLILSLIPIFIILFLDINYSSFSMKNLGVTKYIPNDIINTILKLFGAYCLIQVAAQDFGIKTGEVQGDFFKIPALQFFIYTGVAFALTQNRSVAMIGALLYFQMKYFVSDGVTKDVCFE
jgi:hypothetical protein